MVTLASLCFGCEGFLTFCVMLTAGLVRVFPGGMDAFVWISLMIGTATFGRYVGPAEEGTEALWPLYGTGPPAKGP